MSLFIPFPAEVENSSNLQCFDPTQSKVITSANCDPNMAEYLAVLLSDASDDLAEM